MLRANLYEFGRDMDTDRAIHLFPALDNFIATKNEQGAEAGFSALRELLGTPPVSPAANAYAAAR